jgi:hypothetical protein
MMSTISKMSAVVCGSRGIPGMEDMPRSIRTLETSITRIASYPALTTQSTSASWRSLWSSMNSISSSRLSQGLSP